MKILLLGKNGQVGTELQRSLAPLGEVIALDRHSQDSCGDLLDLPRLEDTILNIRPDVIVNAAAYTAVDKAEDESELVYKVNASAPACLAKVAKSINALLIHYSTDYVFSGEGEAAWREDDATCPQNVYGRSKLEGEKAISASGCEYLIFRTCWVYAVHGQNFLKTMLKLASSNASLKIINDQVGAPTGADLIADITAKCIQNFQPGKAGIYHLAANGYTTWYEYAQYLFSIAKEQGMKLSITPETVEPVNSSEFKTAAKRPLNSRLSCKKLLESFDVFLPDWQFGVKSAVIHIIGANK